MFTSETPVMAVNCNSFIIHWENLLSMYLTSALIEHFVESYSCVMTVFESSF